MGVSGSQPAEQNSWSPLGSHGACVCPTESSPSILSFAETGSLASRYHWKQPERPTTKAIRGPPNSPAVLVHARPLVVSQALEESPTSGIH